MPAGAPGRARLLRQQQGRGALTPRGLAAAVGGRTALTPARRPVGRHETLAWLAELTSFLSREALC